MEGGEVLVGRFAGAAPVTVVVDDQDAAGHEARIELLELVARGGVPVGVEAQQGDGGGSGFGQRRGYVSFDEPETFEGIAGAAEIGFDRGARGDAPERVVGGGASSARISAALRPLIVGAGAVTPPKVS